MDLTGAAVGSWDVYVANPDGRSDTLSGGFTVNNSAPTVTAITPNSGVTGGTVSVTNLAGTNFYGTPTVQLKRTGEEKKGTGEEQRGNGEDNKWNGKDNITATDVVVVSSTQITCSFDLTGAAAGSWDVYVANPDSQDATLSGGFTVNNPAPTLTSISPTSATAGSPKVKLSLVGTNFVPTSVVLWNGTPLKTTHVHDRGKVDDGHYGYVDTTHLHATIPKGDLTTAGTFSVTVSNPTLRRRDICPADLHGQQPGSETDIDPPDERNSRKS